MIKLTREILAISLVLFISTIASGQHYQTYGGGNARNGATPYTGPVNSDRLWTVNSSVSNFLGSRTLIHDDKVAVARFSANPFMKLIECRDLHTGDLLWESSPALTGNDFGLVGFSSSAVYGFSMDVVGDSTRLIALNPEDGSILWEFVNFNLAAASNFTNSLLFTCEEDPIFFRNSSHLICLDKNTGMIKWENSEIISTFPSPDPVAADGSVFRVRGAINFPLHPFAIDINSGVTTHVWDDIMDMGNGLFQGVMATSRDGQTVYIWLNGNFQQKGFLYAFSKKEGGGGVPGTDGFDLKWTFEPEAENSVPLVGSIGVGPDETIYIVDSSFVKRLDPATGAIMHTSPSINIPNPQQQISSNFTISPDGTIYLVVHYQMLVYSPDLNLLWSENLPDLSLYTIPAIGKDGIMVLAPSGNEIFAYQPATEGPPVSDFAVDTSQATLGLIDFQDKSSFAPTSWSWIFDGGNPNTSTDQNPTGISYSQPGTYSVTLITTNAMGTDTLVQECSLTISVLTTGLEETVIDENLLILYPNPTTGRLHLELESTREHTASIFIRDMLGRTQFFEETPLVKGTNQLVLELPAYLPEGTYFLEVVGHRRLIILTR